MNEKETARWVLIGRIATVLILALNALLSGRFAVGMLDTLNKRCSMPSLGYDGLTTGEWLFFVALAFGPSVLAIALLWMRKPLASLGALLVSIGTLVLSYLAIVFLSIGVGMACFH